MLTTSPRGQIEILRIVRAKCNRKIFREQCVVLRYTLPMKKKERITWSQLWSMIGPCFHGLGLMYGVVIFLTIFAAAAQVAEPIIYGMIIDQLFLGTDQMFVRLTPLIGCWIGAYVVSIPVAQVAQWLSWDLGLKVHNAFLYTALRRVMYWDPDRFGKESSGALAKRIDQAWERTFDIAGRTLVDVLPALVSFVAVLVSGVFLNISMTIASLVMVPFAILITIKVYLKAEDRQKALMESWEGLSGRISEMIHNVLPIKIFTGEERIMRQIGKVIGEVGQRQTLLNRLWAMLGAGNGLLRLCARVIVLVSGVYLIARGELTVGVLATFLGMLTYLLAPFDYLLGDIMRRASETRGAFARVARDWFADNRLSEVAQPKRLNHVQGEVLFQDVSYCYPGKKKEALRNITLHIPAGSSLALVGKSGSGKSTMVKFVNRFLDPTSGKIFIDGVNICEAVLEDVRGVVGVVQQDTVLFNDTIYNNVRFAHPQATKREVEAACEAAQAHDFIQKLPKGYNTLVGERGVKLSGGERQRLSLARVFLANPPIVILDESTSALDSETENRVQEALAQVMKGRTTIVIAHRLSTVYMADCIVVLDEGKIVEMGTHQALLEKGGLYERLWKLQSGGYLPE